MKPLEVYVCVDWPIERINELIQAIERGELPEAGEEGLALLKEQLEVWRFLNTAR